MPDTLVSWILNVFFTSVSNRGFWPFFPFPCLVLDCDKEHEFVKQQVGLEIIFVGMEIILLTFFYSHLRLFMEYLVFMAYYLLD